MNNRYKLMALGAVSLVLASCGSDEPASHDAMDHSGHDMSAMESPPSGKKGGMDYKAMFGPDYKKGDVGHSTGTVISKAPEADYITIDHGKIHGMGMGAMTMGFDVPETVDLSDIEEGAEVEFLIKKGQEEGTFLVFALCDMDAEGPQCLNKTIDQ